MLKRQYIIYTKYTTTCIIPILFHIEIRFTDSLVPILPGGWEWQSGIPRPMPTPFTPAPRPRPGKSPALAVKPPRGIPATPPIPRPRDWNSDCVDFGGGGLAGIGWPDHMPRPILGAWGFCCSAHGSLGAGAMLTRKYAEKKIVSYMKIPAY